MATLSRSVSPSRAARRTRDRQPFSAVRLAFGANVLIVGSPDRDDHETVGQYVRGPVRMCGATLTLPPPGTGGTLILKDLSSLDREQQQLLARWLDENANRTQVVSFSEDPVYPLVEAGKFLDTLYYRLNAIYVDLQTTAFKFATPEPTVPSRARSLPD